MHHFLQSSPKRLGAGFQRGERSTPSTLSSAFPGPISVNVASISGSRNAGRLLARSMNTHSVAPAITGIPSRCITYRRRLAGPRRLWTHVVIVSSSPAKQGCRYSIQCSRATHERFLALSVSKSQPRSAACRVATPSIHRRYSRLLTCPCTSIEASVTVKTS